jgi:hypothetical protein
MRDGKAKRVPGNVADELIASGQAQHFISNTVFRAMKLGIEVKDPKTRDMKGELRAKISEARAKLDKKRSKADKKHEEEERELLEEDAA